MTQHSIAPAQPDTAHPTIVTVPCFSGAPWDLTKFTGLSDWPMRTMALPDGLDTIDDYAAHVAGQVGDLDEYVLVGDSFGAVIALAHAIQQPTGLRALVLSGGFASNPLTSRIHRAKVSAANFLPGPLYRHLTLPMHAAALKSPYDLSGERPLTQADIVDLFRQHTPWRSYTGRARAALSADYRNQLDCIQVPTLVLTPEHDTLIGEQAAATLRESIPDVREQVLTRTGHMFRFTHPHVYSQHIADFLTTTGCR